MVAAPRYGWEDPAIQHHLAVLEKAYGTGAAQLSTRTMCNARRAYDRQV